MRMTRDEREHRFMNLAAGVGSLDSVFSFIHDLMQDLNAIEAANGDSATPSPSQSGLPQNEPALTSGDGSESAGLREALVGSMVALDDWLNVHASDHCDETRVKEAYKRIREHGTIAYIAKVQERNRVALAAHPSGVVTAAKDMSAAALESGASAELAISRPPTQGSASPASQEHSGPSYPNVEGYHSDRSPCYDTFCTERVKPQSVDERPPTHELVDKVLDQLQRKLYGMCQNRVAKMLTWPEINAAFDEVDAQLSRDTTGSLEKLQELRKRVSNAVCTNIGIPYDEGGSAALSVIIGFIKEVEAAQTPSLPPSRADLGGDRPDEFVIGSDGKRYRVNDPNIPG